MMSQCFGGRPLPGFIGEVHGVDHTDDGRINGRVGAADGGHGGKTFRGKQNAVADAGAHGVKREDRIAAIRTVELEWLDDEDLAPFVRGDFLRGNHIAYDAADQHARKCRVQNQKFKE